MNNIEYLETMGAKIKEARQAKGIFQRNLGKMCNLHHSAISEIETGQRNSHILTLRNLAD